MNFFKITKNAIVSKDLHPMKYEYLGTIIGVIMFVNLFFNWHRTLPPAYIICTSIIQMGIFFKAITMTYKMFVVVTKIPRMSHLYHFGEFGIFLFTHCQLYRPKKSFVLRWKWSFQRCYNENISYTRLKYSGISVVNFVRNTSHVLDKVCSATWMLPVL